MKKKEEIYVVVDTPKKAKNLQKVLDMFKERIEKNTIDSLEHYTQPWLTKEPPAVYFDSQRRWICQHAEYLEGKQKVSIKELRNILAVDKLKEGDVVVCRNKEEQVEHLFKIDDKDDNTVWYQSRLSNEDGLMTQYGSWTLNHFIRYATEEEKALLEPKEEKKELEVGKWYKYPEYPEFLSIHTNDGNRYGFDINGLWFNADDSLDEAPGFVEATTEEVKQALAKEASKRGYERVTYDNGELFCRLPYSTVQRVYSNGVWKELDKPVKKTEITDQDIATLERLHDTLSDVHGYSLEFELMKSARVLAEKLRELQKPQCIISG